MVESNKIVGTLQEEFKLDGISRRKSKRRGPPNRMNDLVYRDWMKFQKSFFWYKTDAHLYREFIQFFTKEILPGNGPSRSLILGNVTREELKLDDQRNIDIGPTWAGNGITPSDVTSAHQDELQHCYDFAILDLRDTLRDCESTARFLDEMAHSLFSELASLLVPDKYCALLVPAYESVDRPFPIAWSLALAGRSVMRLRDEKIALSKEDSREIFYCIIFQNNRDERIALDLKPNALAISNQTHNVNTWIIPRPPPRKKNEILHPAKFPETLIQEFIEVFTDPGDTVFDPMVGTGSTVIAALKSGRNAIGVELNEKWTEIAQDRIKEEFQPTLFDTLDKPSLGRVICADAKDIQSICEIEKESADYVVTSPPYWSMLNNPGSEYQKARREKKLSLVYSEKDTDLGNIEDYDVFLDLLTEIYCSVANILKPHAVMTIIVKNVKRNHVVYPLAWDLVARLCAQNGKFEYLGNTLWCQDDIGLKPFGVGIVWVSNIVHQYCLHFKRR